MIRNDTKRRGDPKPILTIENLAISYETRNGDVQAVRNVTLAVHPAETVCVVGESGCGKSTLAFGIVNFLGKNGKVVEGSIRFRNEEMIGISAEKLRKIRGKDIGMVYQDPMQALNPALRIGRQLSETLIAHQHMEKAEAFKKSIDILKRVYMPDALAVMDRYPHQLSGGQQQRVSIAIAFLNNPALLLMDEPTTALDVTVEATVIDLIKDLKNEFRAGILFITHNLGLVARISDYIVVMYAGEVVEKGTTLEIFKNSLHPYTWGLMRCVPKLGFTKESSILHPIRGRVPSPTEISNRVCTYYPRCDHATDECRAARPKLREITVRHFVRCFHAEKIIAERQQGLIVTSKQERTIEVSKGDEQRVSTGLKVTDLKTYYQQESKTVLGLLGLGKKTYVKAVDGISFEIPIRSILGVVGESGCGKTTLIKTLIGLEKSNAGNAKFLTFDLSKPLSERKLDVMKNIQMVFQNPDSTLNPSYSVGAQIARPIKRFGLTNNNEVITLVKGLLRSVRLASHYYYRKPRQLSGGEKQRVAIARALSCQPELILCDEPVSALDVSVQANILNMLKEIQKTSGKTILFISHDLSVVRFISDFVAVMYLGNFMELGTSDAVYQPPYHPYTEALLSAVPVPDPTIKQKHIRLSSDIPSPVNPPSGCRFHTRCHMRKKVLANEGRICKKEVPPVRQTKEGHYIMCHIPLDILNANQQIIGETSYPTMHENSNSKTI